MKKIYAPSGRLFVYHGDIEHQWVLKDIKGNVYFNGTADEVNSHIDEMTDKGCYFFRAKKGRKKKDIS